MAHKRKDTLTKPPEWWKHMRPENKRRIAHSERRAAKRLIGEVVAEQDEELSCSHCPPEVQKRCRKVAKP